MWFGVANQNEIGGWSLSLALHMILLTIIWPALQQLPSPVLREPFRWNVTFVESPQSTAVVESSNYEALLHPDVHSGDAEEPTPVAPTPVRPSLIPSPSSKSHVTQPARAPAIATISPAPVDTSPEGSEVGVPTAPLTEPMLMTQDAAPSQHGVIEQTQTAAPVRTELSTLVATRQGQDAPVSPRPAVTEAPAALDQPAGPSPAPPTTVPSAPFSKFSGPRSDYSWLQRAVSRRLEELKRFSRPSLGDVTKLKVLVKAVVSKSGELIETEVVTSSGFARIDQEAVALVQRAFPVSLDDVIDRPQIVMRIPITYSRD